MFLTLTATTFFCGETIAQVVDETPSEWAIDGSKEPEKVPFAVQVRELIRSHDSIAVSNFAQLLSMSDRQILANLQSQQRAFYAGISDQSNTRFAKLCSERNDFEADELASAYQDIYAEKLQAEDEYYRRALNAISQLGRESIDGLLLTTIAPAIRMSDIVADTNKMASASPERLKAIIGSMCYSGYFKSFPPGIYVDIAYL
jgi:hypothetical protein